MPTPLTPRSPDIPCTAEYSQRPSSISFAIVYRAVAAIALAATLAFLIIAGSLRPDTQHGLGTHTQFDLPDCEFLQSTGYPCPTCGYTTAACLAAQGQIGLAFVTQPAAALFTLLIAMSAWLNLHVLVTANPRPWRIIVQHLSLKSVAIALFILIALAWAYRVVLALN